jgi:hypothetical protein
MYNNLEMPHSLSTLCSLKERVYKLCVLQGHVPLSLCSSFVQRTTMSVTCHSGHVTQRFGLGLV